MTADGRGMTLPDPRQTPVMTVEAAGRVLGLGRSKSYEEARRWLATDGREGLPCLRFGRSLKVPTSLLLRTLGIEVDR